MIKALMIDVDGVLVCGRPSDGTPWSSTIEDDLGVSVADLQREFFSPYWDEIVLGRAALIDHLKPALSKIAPHLSYDDFIAYWFENDAQLNTKLLDELHQQREAGKRVYLATNQEHVRAAHLVEVLGLIAWSACVPETIVAAPPSLWFDLAGLAGPNSASNAVACVSRAHLFMSCLSRRMQPSNGQEVQQPVLISAIYR